MGDAQSQKSEETKDSVLDLLTGFQSYQGDALFLTQSYVHLRRDAKRKLQI